MAQTVAEIAELINDMRVESGHNAENLEKVLTGINNKLELLNDDEEKADLIRIYISELKKAVEERHGTTLLRLDELQTASKNIISVIGDLKIEDNVKSQIQDMTRELLSQIDELPNKISFQNVENKIDELRPVLSSLENIVKDSLDKNSSEIRDNFEDLQKSFDNIVTDADFKGFKSDLADFVQKIIDNSSALNSELSYSTERIENILTTVKSLDFRDDFNSIAEKIENLKEAFEGGAKINYGNLSSEISELTKNFNESFNHLDTGRQVIYSELKSEMTAILDNLKVLSAISYQKSFDELSGITAQIADNINSVKSSLNSNTDFSELKSGIETIISDLKTAKDDIINSNDINSSIEHINSISEKFDKQVVELNNLKTLIESSDKIEPSEILSLLDNTSVELTNLISSVNENLDSNYEALKDYVEELSSNVSLLQTEFKEITSNNSEKIISGLSSISEDFSVLKEEFHQNAKAGIENSERIALTIDDISNKISGMQDVLSENSSNNFEALKTLLENLSSQLEIDFNNQREIFSNQSTDLEKLDSLNKLSEDIKNIENALAKNSETYQSAIKDEISNIREYLDDINSSSNRLNAESNDKLFAKLEILDILNNTFENSISSLNSKISDIIDNLSTNTDNNNFIKTNIDNLKTDMAEIISNLENSGHKNDELSLIISSLMENVAKKDGLDDLSSKIDNLDNSYDIQQISSKLDDLSVLLENSTNLSLSDISDKIDLIRDDIKGEMKNSENTSGTLLSKLDDFAYVLAAIKGIVEVSSDSNARIIEKQIEKFQSSLENIITTEDFNSFKTDFNEFLQKLIDNTNISNINSDILKEKITEIIEKIETLNNTDGFENIDNRLSDIKLSFENNSKMNYENIVNEINNLKSEINSNISANNNNELAENINLKLEELLLSIKMLSDTTSQKHSVFADNISAELHETLSEINERISSNSELNFGELKVSMESIISELNKLKYDIETNKEDNALNISSGFENTKELLASLSASIESVSSMFESTSGENAENILSRISDLSFRVDELKNELNQSDNTNKILESINEISIKIDEYENNYRIDEKIVSLKDAVNGLASDIQLSKEEFGESVKENIELQSNQLKNISENMTDIKLHIEEVVQGLKDYVEELNIASKTSKQTINEDITDKLVNLEGVLSESAQNYEQRIDMLQEKISEFAHIVENSNADTEGKISSSIEEISVMKDELVMLSEVLKTSKLSNDEKFNETISLLDAGVENISFSINALSEGIKNGLSLSLKENTDNIETKIEELVNIFKEVQNQNNSPELFIDINEKLTVLDSDLKSIISEINDSVYSKSEEIMNAFEPIKTGVEEFIGLGFDKIIGDLKSQLELSFMNFNIDMNSEISNQHESIKNLEDAYKNVFNKISNIEECVTDNLQNNLELLSNTLETGIKDIKYSFDSKIEENFDELKSHIDIAANNTKIAESIVNLKDNLTEKIEKLASEQNNISLQHENIIAGVSAVTTNLKEYITAVVKALVDKYAPKEQGVSIESIQKDITQINSKIDVIALDGTTQEIKENLDELQKNIDQVNSKIDVIALDDSTQEMKENIEELQKNIDQLNSKIDIIALDNSSQDIQENFNEIFETLDSNLSAQEFRDNIIKINETLSNNVSTAEMTAEFDSIQNNFKSEFENVQKALSSDINEIKSKLDISDTLTALHAKIDTLASDNTAVSLLDEVDDIRNILNEHRKFYEESTDEKAAAIDKYLRDVLLKLDNVDLEKNAEDIKNSILNALISVSDQISFVEESEDIKDFVEEKTGELQKSLSEVQNQLKQIASSNDDFEYTYTLQDVESDIAKLRIAINNISGTDLDDINEEIEKIVNSIEKIESTLTQDQANNLKDDIEKLSDEIISISTRTNKLLLNSDESYKVLSGSLNDFSNLIYKLDDRISYLDNKEYNERLERKIDNIHSLAVSSGNADKIFHQVMMYLGEWIDSTTENINSLIDKTDKFSDIKEAVCDVQNSIPDKEEIINELKELVPDNTEIIEKLKTTLDSQEERIESLENKLDKVLSKLEEKDDTVLNRKIDKLEKMLSSFGANIEKLTSYVDE